MLTRIFLILVFSFSTIFIQKAYCEESHISLKDNITSLCDAIYQNDLELVKILIKIDEEQFSYCLYYNNSIKLEKYPKLQAPTAVGPLNFAVLLDRDDIIYWLIDSKYELKNPKNHAPIYQLGWHDHYLFTAIKNNMVVNISFINLNQLLLL